MVHRRRSKEIRPFKNRIVVASGSTCWSLFPSKYLVPLPTAFLFLFLAVIPFVLVRKRRRGPRVCHRARGPGEPGLDLGVVDHVVRRHIPFEPSTLAAVFLGQPMLRAYPATAVGAIELGRSVANGTVSRFRQHGVNMLIYGDYRLLKN